MNPLELEVMERDLQKQSWAILGNESRAWSLLRIAELLGAPQCAPNGDLVKCLTPQASSRATQGTFTHRFGCASFPFHTDTAFWHLPARYLVMRVAGDFRRTTNICSFKSILKDNLLPIALSSVWIIRSNQPFYSTMRFLYRGNIGYKYDPVTMSPANSAAKYVLETIESDCSKTLITKIDWASTGTLIVDNWHAMHSRGPEPLSEGPRVLERIYVRQT